MVCTNYLWILNVITCRDIGETKMIDSFEQQINAHAEQITKMNLKLKDLEKQLDNYFIVSQKYSRLKQLVREIKQILKEVEKPTGIMSYVKNEILQRISEVEE